MGHHKWCLKRLYTRELFHVGILKYPNNLCSVRGVRSVFNSLRDFHLGPQELQIIDDGIQNPDTMGRRRQRFFSLFTSATVQSWVDFFISLNLGPRGYRCRLKSGPSMSLLTRVSNPTITVILGNDLLTWWR